MESGFNERHVILGFDCNTGDAIHLVNPPMAGLDWGEGRGGNGHSSGKDKAYEL